MTKNTSQQIPKVLDCFAKMTFSICTHKKECWKNRQLSLGILYRRGGLIDRAIEVHGSLLSVKDLTKEHRDLIVFFFFRTSSKFMPPSCCALLVEVFFYIAHRELSI